MHKNTKILIVDDEELMRILFVEAMRLKGFKAVGADCAESAMEMLGEGDVPILFLDINLPGMDGFELCSRIRRQRPGSIIYAVSGNAFIQEQSRNRDAYFDGYFVKPVTMNKIHDAVIHAMDRLAVPASGPMPQ